MRARLLFCMLATGLFWTCDEPERLSLFYSEITSTTDSTVTIRTVIVDLPTADVTSYGHCWANKENPTLSDEHTEINGALVSGNVITLERSTFVTNQTYFIRPYLIRSSGAIEYGGAVTLNRPTAFGSWSRLPEMFEETTDIWYVNYRKSLLLSSGGFFQDEPFVVGGALFQGGIFVDGSMSDYYPVIFQQSYYANKIFDKAQNAWKFAGTYDGEMAYGRIGHVYENSFYTGLGSSMPLFGTFIDYVGCPADEICLDNEFYMFDLQNQIWVQLETFPGAPRAFATSFIAGSKIYVVGGLAGIETILNDCWIYDIVSGSWSQGPDLPGPGRLHAVGFSTGDKGYVGSGMIFPYDTANQFLNDFYSIETQTNTWQRVRDFPGEARYGAAAFGLGDFGYFGTGSTRTYNGVSNCNFIEKMFKDFWRYEPLTDQWVKLKDFPGNPRQFAVGFSNSRWGAVGLGRVVKETHTAAEACAVELYESDLWVYDPTKN